MRRYGELKLHIPEEEIQGVYRPGDQYAFYRDLSSLFEAATQEILIVDAYLNEELFNLYVSKVASSVKVRILTNNIGANVETVARKYAKSRPLEMRSITSIHDRHIFIDHRGWVIGQSIKDAARKTPTYLVEIEEPSLGVTRAEYLSIWQRAVAVVLTS